MNLLGAKVYFDGRHWIAIRHTERHSKLRRKAVLAEKSQTVEQFEKAFNKTTKGRKSKKKERLLQEFLPHFDSESEATEFVETQFERLNRNRIERFKRLKRKAYLQQWHYFCTFTYADGKQTEESFRKQLMNGQGFSFYIKEIRYTYKIAQRRDCVIYNYKIIARI